jgi:hypothetical protein
MTLLTLPLDLNTYVQTFNFSNQSALDAQVAIDGSWSGLGSFTVAGISIAQSIEDDLLRVGKYVGERNVPHDVRYQRRSTSELMRRMGQPVIVKHMFNPEDELKGLARKSDNFLDAYGQVRNRDPLSYGVGYCSIENSTDEWIAPDGSVVTASVSPGSGYVSAPKYRGFGPGYLTYIIEPDAAIDLYLHTQAGAFVRVQQATAVTAWFPEINDNDLIINVTLDATGHVIDTGDRYVAKKTNPISIRGTNRRGRQEYSGDRGNAHLVNQQFEMDLVPQHSGSALYDVEIDR